MNLEAAVPGLRLSFLVFGSSPKSPGLLPMYPGGGGR